MSKRSSSAPRIKNVEAALRAPANDPFVENVKPRFTRASDNIAQAWRVATASATDRRSSGTRPSGNWPISWLSISKGTAPSGGRQFVQKFRPLISLGLVEVGVERNQIVWPDGTMALRPEEDGSSRWVRLLPRGREVRPPPGSSHEQFRAAIDPPGAGRKPDRRAGSR